MIVNKSYLWQAGLGLTLVWMLGYCPQIKANPNIMVAEQVDSSMDDRGAPKDRQGTANHFQAISRKRQDDGSDRGICPTVDLGMTALVPRLTVGLTISERPTFWFYIPYKDDLPYNADFVLVDEDKHTVYQTELQLAATAGVVGIALPASAAALEVGKKYQWTLSYTCNPNNSEEDAVVRGYVERTALPPEVDKELQAARTPERRYAIYAQNDFWYDTITLLAELLLENPDKFQEHWESLLEKVGLEEIAKEPIVEQKSPE
ncbi:MAG: DUF928 domain-containing protein [Oscillatoria sp. SIO1A7]|nr:DUF928 domain-containing protein [Oscillatoria sp. SIO1A7]